jgi:hypothetical protein
VFVKKNSQQERISSRLIYRVAYISKWNSIALCYVLVPSTSTSHLVIASSLSNQAKLAR